MKFLRTKTVSFFHIMILLVLSTAVLSEYRRKNQASPEVAARREATHIPYYIVSTLAAVDTAVLVKFFIEDITVAHKEMSTDIRQHLRNSLLAANVLLRAGFFVSLQLHPEKYSKVIQTISASSYSKHLYKLKVFILSVLMCSTSFSLIFILTNVGLLGGFEQHLIENSVDMEWLFCPQTICPQTGPKELNSKTIVLGLFGWATKCAGNLYTQIARDGILFAALTLCTSANAFRFKRRVKNATSMDNAIKIGTEIFNDYKWIKKISKHINSAFNMVFRFYLLVNIIMFAVFLDDWFNPNVNNVVKCVKLANIMFVCITFYYANQTAKTGDRFRDWMKKDKNRKIMGLSEYNVLTESASSIGFGRGALFIYDSTLIGIAGVVAAYYFGIVETRPKTDHGLEYWCARCPNFNNSTIL